MGQCDVSIVIGNDRQIRRLNKKFRGMDRSTDVLSFPANERNLETGRDYLGDVFISYPRARLQAAEQNHSIRDEITVLIIHGILHLAGYDHGDKTSEKKMFALQNQIFKILDLEKYPEKSNGFSSSFKHALKGVHCAFRSERNLWIHIAIASLVIAAAFISKLALWEWGLIALAIGFVLSIEFFNTAVEYLVNLVSPERNELARRVKDISAAAVLIAATISIIIGLLVFLPRILTLLFD